MMSEDAKKKIQIALALVAVIVGVRVGYVLYQRHEDNLAAQKQVAAKNVGYANQEFYVAPKKLHPFDLNSAKQLTEQPVWVKEGYKYAYYSYDAARRRTNFSHDAGLLLPIERLEIKDIEEEIGPGAVSRRQMMAVFQKDGKSYAVPVGFETEGQFKIYSDEMFYVEDPHDLYKFWSPDIWQAIAQHEVKPGMDDLQADFAVGMGVPDAGATSASKTVRYPNGGKPLVVEYHGDKVSAVSPGS